MYLKGREEKLVTIPLHAGARLLTSCNGPHLCKRSRGAFWGWRAGQRADQLTSFGVSEAESWCAMSGCDMWLTTWPCCLTHWSERERKREQGQPVQPFAHQWRASPPLNTAYWSAQPAGPLLYVHFLLIISSLFFFYRFLSLLTTALLCLLHQGIFFKQSFEIIICWVNVIIAPKARCRLAREQRSRRSMTLVNTDPFMLWPVQWPPHPKKSWPQFSPPCISVSYRTSWFLHNCTVFYKMQHKLISLR